MPTVTAWMSVVLKTIVGSFMGTVAGLGLGTAAIYLFIANAPQSRTCSDSLGFGMIIMGLVAIRKALASVGFAVGALTALILGVCHTRNTVAPPQINTDI